MPNRILRDWTDSKTIQILSWQEEVLFTRLIMKADDFGNFNGDPLMIKSLCFPRKDGVRVSDIECWLKKLEAAAIIRFYHANGDTFVHIRNFKQRLDKAKRKYPEEPVFFSDNDSVVMDNDSVAMDNDSGAETKRNETILKGTKNIKPFSSDDFFETKEKAFEELRDNELYIVDCILTLTGRGWKSVTGLEVVGLLKYFISAKLDLNKNKSEVRQHFKNWLCSGNTKLEDLVTKAEVFKKQLEAA